MYAIRQAYKSDIHSYYLVVGAVEFEAMAVGVVDGEVVLAPGFEGGRFFNWEADCFELLVEGIGVWCVEFDVCRAVF